MWRATFPDARGQRVIRVKRAPENGRADNLSKSNRPAGLGQARRGDERPIPEQ